MGFLGKKLRSVNGGGLAFWCPGCDELHTIWITSTTHLNWLWNGSLERPAFGPSLLHTSGHFSPGHTGECWCTYNHTRAVRGLLPLPHVCRRCHLSVGCGRAEPGQIEFLPDCSHDLAGQIVDIQDIPIKDK